MNIIATEGCSALLTAAKKNTNITHLDIRENESYMVFSSQIKEQLEKNNPSSKVKDANTSHQINFCSIL